MKKHLFFAAALLSLAACNNEEYNPMDDPNAPVEIRLSSGIDVQTRAPHNLDTQLKAGEQVHVWVDDAGNVADKELYKDKKLTAEGNGSLTGETMYFPQTGNAVNIYAIHGNFGDNTDWTGSGLENKTTHKVEQDQRTGQETDGYAKSDLVYAQSTNVTRTKNVISMTFSHMLSKIEVVLVKGAGSPEISNMEILNTKLEAVFDPDKEHEFWVVPEGDANPIEIDTHLTSANDAKGDDENKKNLNEAIIVPQPLWEGTPFIRVTIAEGGELIYRLDRNITFERAKKYRYTITANLTGLDVTSTIEPWGNGGNYSGDAEMQ